MSNQISTFNFENQSITTAIDVNGEIFFHATELATALGFGNPRQAISTHVDKEDVQKLDTLTKGGKQQVTFTNESGMYALIFGSTKPEAKRFKKWVTSEVLPSIRKNGSYSATLTADQAFQIKKAVEQKCKHNSVHYQTVWTALRNHFGKATYREIESKDFDEAMLFVESLELPQIALPEPSEQPFFLSKNMAREFSARLTHIYDLVDLLDDNKITRKIKQRSSSLEQFLIQYEKNEHPKGVDLA